MATTRETFKEPYDFSNIWDGRYEDVKVDSYLLQNISNIGVDYIRDIIKVIHKTQFPGKKACSTKRLLVLDLSDSSLEGIGSVIREIMFGLAVAIHSNRTLIWGFDSPLLFRYTKELFFEDENFDGTVDIEFPDPLQPSISLDCHATDFSDHISRPFNCFFQPLSECSLENFSSDDWKAYHSGGLRFDHFARVNQFDMHKAIALYHPPYGLFEYIDRVRKQTNRPAFNHTGRAGHIWAASIAAYVFRLKKSVMHTFSERMSYDYPYISDLVALNHLKNEQALKTEERIQEVSDETVDSEQDALPIVWGIHVRHGDLRAYPNIYDQYKTVYGIQKYFDFASDLSRVGGYAPRYVYLATDSIDADNFTAEYRRNQPNRGLIVDNKIDLSKLKQMRNSVINRKQDITAMSSQKGWLKGQVPDLISLSDQKRFRTAHGSHAVAAEGGCVTDPSLKSNERRCSLGLDDLEIYTQHEYYQSVSRAEKIMMVMFESLEDIFLLSLSDKFIGSGSSYFSNIAALLVWARHGVDEYSTRVAFIDGKDITAGRVATAFLPLSHKDLTNSIQQKPKRGRNVVSVVNWEKETIEFLSGMRDVNVKDIGEDWWTVKHRLKIVNMLPNMSDSAFYAESKSWFGVGQYIGRMRGHCPGPFNPPTVTVDKDIAKALLQYVEKVVNLGVEHYSIAHVEQALRCWTDSIDAINRYPHILTSNAGVASAYEIATGNIAAFRKRVYDESLQEDMDLLTFIRRLYHSDSLTMKTGIPSTTGRKDGVRGRRSKTRRNSLVTANIGMSMKPPIDSSEFKTVMHDQPKSMEDFLLYESFYYPLYAKHARLSSEHRQYGQRFKENAQEKPFDYFYRKLNTFKNTRKEMKTLPIVLEDIAQMEHYAYRLTLQNNTLSRLCNA